MKMPLSIALSAINNNEFQIVHFEDEHGPHFHVVIPINDSLQICICIITKQYENLNNYYTKSNQVTATESLVYVNQDAFKFLTAKKGCVINCNNALIISKKQLETKIKDKDSFAIKAYDSDFSADLKKQIINAVINSPIVSPYIKKKIKTVYGII
jgi:tRNA A37 threonylcarbamoyladenosine modification protein TsaB